MSTFCIVCDKKVNILSELFSVRNEEGVVCKTCQRKIDKAVAVYYKETKSYNREQLKHIISIYSDLSNNMDFIDKLEKNIVYSKRIFQIKFLR